MKLTDRDILIQIGYYSEDRIFCSLNLTRGQADILGQAILLSDQPTTEATIAVALQMYIASRKASDAAGEMGVNP